MIRLIVLVLSVLPLAGHDFWIEPSDWHPAPGSRVALRLFVGDDFQGDAFPRDPTHIQRFAVIGPAGASPVAGLDGRDPAGFVRLATAGAYVVAYESHPRLTEIEAPQFDSYLGDEGLEAILKQRARQGRSATPGRERFSRCAKTLLNTAAEDGFDQAVGLTLELIPEASPFRLGGDGSLPVRLLFRGRPLAGARVTAIARSNAAARQVRRSDSEGRVVFRIGEAGPWLIKVVHMEPRTGDSEADWRSWWASLTFGR